MNLHNKNNMMKTLIILLACTLTLSNKLTQGVLPSHSIIALESTQIPNLFLSIEGGDCLTTPQGKCGTLYGVNLASTTAIRTVLNENKSAQLTVVQNQDYYCFKSEQFDALLGLEGTGCGLQASAPCGKAFVYKGVKCSIHYGWRATMVLNRILLKSVYFDNVYLYLNTEKCGRPDRLSEENPVRCGEVMGYYFTDRDVQESELFKRVYFNFHQVATPTR
jgi:hypothetical protein